MLKHTEYASWFAQLDALLVSQRRWWQVQPFHHRRCCWTTSAPQLASALALLSDERVAELDADAAQLAEWLSPWIPKAVQLLSLSQLPSLTAEAHLSTDSLTPLAPPARMAEGIPGRKWQQLLAFAGCIPVGKSPILEWCAGKGHLGRLLSSVQGREVKSLEWQAKLCAQGEQQALHWRLPQRFVCADAFAAESAEQLLAGEQVVALHACGDLHTDLMQRWSKALETTPESMLANSKPSRLTLSPCCYHLIRAEQYQPMSAAGQASALRLSRADLQLPLQQSVTAGAHVRRRGEQETLWRLAFDELQRDLRGVDEYLPLPNLKKSLLNGGFAAFARWAFETKAMPELAARCEAEVHGFKVEEQNTQSTDSERLKAKHFNAEHYLTRGAERLQHTRRMELVTHAFRRPLEVWLALDRALFLSERGARVSLSTFCEAALTPRNILLHAQHSPSGAR